METYKVGLALEPDNQELKDGLAYAYATGHVVCVVSYVLPVHWCYGLYSAQRDSRFGTRRQGTAVAACAAE